jgi:CheY-like chemotaxis protein
MVLEEQGHHATGVPSPDEALHLLQTETFDVIVTEYKLSGTTGPEFILKLREVARGTPVILLSGYVDVLGLNERTTGADVVLMKSASETSHLTHAVSRLLRMKPAVRRSRKRPVASDVEPLRKAPRRTGTHE